MNLLDRVFELLFAILLLILLPMLHLYQQAGQASQTVVSEATVAFVEDVRTAGCITAESYLAFASRLDSTGGLYDIELTHSAYKVQPIFSAAGEVEGVGEYYLDTYSPEIRAALQRGMDYQMNQGDYISITVRGRDGQGALKSLLGTVYTTYGGRIRGRSGE